MPAAARKIIATIAIIALVVVYGPIAMEIGARVAVRTGPLVQLVYFVAAGLLWIVPAGALIAWAWRGPRA